MHGIKRQMGSWKNIFLSKKLNKKFAYISLFGKDDIKQIKQEIILQAYRISRTISEISKNAKKLRFDKILDEVTP